MGITDINMNERMAYFNVMGLSMAVIDHAQIRKVEHYGLLESGTAKKVAQNSIFNACSMSKFITGIIVMLLAEQGLVDLDEDINKKLTSWSLPNNKYTENKKVTLRSLLSHQSGIVDPKDSFIELKMNDVYPPLLDLLKGKTPYCKVPIEVGYEPGSDFQYSDAGYCIIQLLIEDVTGNSFESLVDELIFQPLEMHHSTFLMAKVEEESNCFSCGHKKNGELVAGNYTIYPYPAAAGLWTTPSDLSMLVIEIMNALKGKSTIGLSMSKAKELINPQGSKEWTGLGIFLDESNGKLEISSLGWGVGYQCMMVAYPYLETGLVIMTNTDLGVHQLKGLIGEVYASYCSSL